MTESELENFYRSEYRQVYQGSEDPVKKDLTVQKARAEILANVLKSGGVEKIRRFADIGSSSGLLLEKIRHDYQCQVIGIEPGEAYRDYSDNKGLKIYESLKSVRRAGEAAFDLISMIHVLEHISDPAEYLKQLRKTLLSSDGKILIEVPNLYAHDCFEIAHLTSFSRHTLHEVMKKAGYSTLFLQIHGQPRSNIIPLYITLIAAPLAQESDDFKVNIERWIRLKRRAGMMHRRIIQRLFPNQAWLPEYRS
jgi:SAM-dependent methyltransferase